MLKINTRYIETANALTQFGRIIQVAHFSEPTTIYLKWLNLTVGYFTQIDRMKCVLIYSAFCGSDRSIQFTITPEMLTLVKYAPLAGFHFKLAEMQNTSFIARHLTFSF